MSNMSQLRFSEQYFQGGFSFQQHISLFDKVWSYSGNNRAILTIMHYDFNLFHTIPVCKCRASFLISSELAQTN